VLHAIDEVVVADDGGNRRAQTGRGRDQGLGDARRDDREAGGALGTDAVEGRHDAPHGAEQADERRGAGGGCQERQVVLESGDLEGGGPPEGAVHRFEAVGAEPVVEVVEHLVEHLGDPHHLLIGGEIELRERALPQLARCAVHDGRAPRLAEDAKELERLPANASKLPCLLNDESPAHDRKHHEH